MKQRKQILKPFLTYFYVCLMPYLTPLLSYFGTRLTQTRVRPVKRHAFRQTPTSVPHVPGSKITRLTSAPAIYDDDVVSCVNVGHFFQLIQVVKDILIIFHVILSQKNKDVRQSTFNVYFLSIFTMGLT